MPFVRRETWAREQLGPTCLRGVGSSARACAAVSMRKEQRQVEERKLERWIGTVCEALNFGHSLGG